MDPILISPLNRVWAPLELVSPLYVGYHGQIHLPKSPLDAVRMVQDPLRKMKVQWVTRGVLEQRNIVGIHQG